MLISITALVVKHNYLFSYLSISPTSLQDFGRLGFYMGALCLQHPVQGLAQRRYSISTSGKAEYIHEQTLFQCLLVEGSMILGYLEDGILFHPPNLHF